jgi:hypothetical protein
MTAPGACWTSHGQNYFTPRRQGAKKTAQSILAANFANAREFYWRFAVGLLSASSVKSAVNFFASIKDLTADGTDDADGNIALFMQRAKARSMKRENPLAPASTFTRRMNSWKFRNLCVSASLRLCV